MKITFTGTYIELQAKLSSLSGEWDENQPNKKVFKLYGAVMNWFETTGTLQFQGKALAKEKLENTIKHNLYPEEFDKIESEVSVSEIDNTNNTPKTVSADLNQTISDEFLNNQFENSEIIIGLVSAVGTEISRVVTPLIDRLTGFGYNVVEVKVSSLLPSYSDSTVMNL